ncbi:MAG: hypothetical protein FJW31_20000 [Acidobacteria bacterium]|nr:hypothetical protein [Acidobacteriota bacterium]
MIIEGREWKPMAVREFAGERRKRVRNYKETPGAGGTKLTYLSANGITVVVPGRLVELSEDGCCLEPDQPIETGILATLTGQVGPMGSHRVRGRITWCRLRSLRAHRAGVQFLEPVQAMASESRQQHGKAGGAKASSDAGALPDYYETLQLADTMRILTQSIASLACWPSAITPTIQTPATRSASARC